jgi:hypothetical protein
MNNKKPKPDPKMQAWIDARKHHHLSHAQVQMARELGMNPNKLGKIDNHKQEAWKAPLPDFIEYLYEKRFGKERPDVVLAIEEMVNRDAEKKLQKREAKLQRRLEKAAEQDQAEPASLPRSAGDDAAAGVEELFS